MGIAELRLKSLPTVPAYRLLSIYTFFILRKVREAPVRRVVIHDQLLANDIDRPTVNKSFGKVIWHQHG